MTVTELIEELKQYPSHVKVFVEFPPNELFNLPDQKPLIEIRRWNSGTEGNCVLLSA